MPLERKILLPANSEFRLDVSSDDELKSLTQDGPAWITIEADNPNMQGYYFNFNKSGNHKFVAVSGSGRRATFFPLD